MFHHNFLSASLIVSLFIRLIRYSSSICVLMFRLFLFCFFFVVSSLIIVFAVGFVCTVSSEVIFILLWFCCYCRYGSSSILRYYSKNLHIYIFSIHTIHKFNLICYSLFMLEVREVHSGNMFLHRFTCFLVMCVCVPVPPFIIRRFVRCCSYSCCCCCCGGCFNFFSSFQTVPIWHGCHIDTNTYYNQCVSINTYERISSIHFSHMFNLQFVLDFFICNGIPIMFHLSFHGKCVFNVVRSLVNYMSVSVLH